MSFFTKLLGGEDKSKTPPPPPPKSEEEKMAQKKIKIEGALNDLDMKIGAFQQKEKKFEHKIQILKAKAKQLIAADKKKQARKYAEQATKVSKQLESYSLRKKVLVDKKFQLETAMMDMETVGALGDATEHLKDQEQYADKMQDIILDGEQAKMRQKEIDQKMRDMVGDNSDQQDVDDMLNELMGQVKAEKKKQVEGGKNVNVIANAGVSKQKKEADEIEDMLANL